MQNDATQPQATRAGDTPLVSVIIPAYNAAEFIGGALRSVFAQTFTDYEVIVVNDGSPDTPALERALAPYAGRIVYVAQENRGPSGARNTAILRSEAEFVALLDSDDSWLPEFLAEQVAALRADEGLDLVFADALLFGETPLAGRTFMQTLPFGGEVTMESLLRWECSVLTSSVVARRRALVAAGLFDEAFRRSEDFDLWFRLLHRGGRIEYQRRVLARHRAHDESLAADRLKMIESQMEVYQKLDRELVLTPELRELIRSQLAQCRAHHELESGKRLILAGKYSRAAQSLARANGILRRPKLRLALWALRAAPRLVRWAYVMRQRAKGLAASRN